MNKSLFLLPIAALIVSCSQVPADLFKKYFNDSTLRIDYFHEGDAHNESVEIDSTYAYELWAGSKVNLIDTMNLGAYYYKIYDESSGKLIYSKGFDSYFREYQTTNEALEGKVRQYHESAIIPMPVDKIIFALDKRDKSGTLHEVFRSMVDPVEAQTAQKDPEIKVYTMLENGDPSIKADILFVAEGYTIEEEEKVRKDLDRFTEILFKTEPFISYKDRFNIRGVFKSSAESGVDEPRSGIDKRTAVNASFNSLGSARYLLTEDNKSLRDIAGHAPYDALYIMVNHTRYGGGGIYNFYCVFTTDNIHSEYLMIHESGHSVFGLADEYYISSTAYNDFYPAGFEPGEPNITALLDPDNIKWKHLLTEGIQVPTPWNKSEFDNMDSLWQIQRAKMNSQISSLKKNGAPEEKIQSMVEQYNLASLEQDRKVTDFLDNNEMSGKVGAFEGAGYASTGLYRPTLNCIMFSRAQYFCPVCQDAIKRGIENYSK